MVKIQMLILYLYCGDIRILLYFGTEMLALTKLTGVISYRFVLLKKSNGSPLQNCISVLVRVAKTP